MAIEQAKNSVMGGGKKSWSPLDSGSSAGGDTPLKKTDGKGKKKMAQADGGYSKPTKKGKIGGVTVKMKDSYGGSTKNTDLLEEGKKAYNKAKNWVKSKMN